MPLFYGAACGYHLFGFASSTLVGLVRCNREISAASIREGLSMPAVPITSREQYIKAIEVLTRLGGTWQGVGRKERYLLVSEAQYNALVEAKVVAPQDTEEDPPRGKKSPKNAKF
jgi:hypothetical protein